RTTSKLLVSLSNNFTALQETLTNNTDTVFCLASSGFAEFDPPLPIGFPYSYCFCILKFRCDWLERWSITFLFQVVPACLVSSRFHTPVLFHPCSKF
ncbi:hypothetical protein, partial [Levilactobacillus koreensis]|uniref:hypothetical protein n=1 Tax=Levilactobacillus koreensis TaxID=637971 RepID=UPI001F4118A2